VPSDYLLILGDRDPLAWVLAKGQMAFAEHRAKDAARLAKGDRLFLYTTRGCFRSPGRDQSRIIGEAVVKSSVRRLDKPVEFGDQAFPLGCTLSITGLATRDRGPEMTELIRDLHLFPNSRSWAIRLRRVLVPLDSHDAGVLHRKLKRIMRPPKESIGGYLVRTRFASSEDS
jgi:hypothetical protein